MTNNKIFKASLFLLMGVLMFSSCTKEDSVVIVEEEEELEIGLRMSINDTEINLDAYASYCMTEGQEFISIGSNADNLEFPLATEEFSANDFSFFKNIGEETGNWDLGGMALEGSILGLEDITLAILFSDAVINITSNDGEIVVGTAAGILRYFDPAEPVTSISEYPYSMRFAAEIIQESTFCQ